MLQNRLEYGSHIRVIVRYLALHAGAQSAGKDARPMQTGAETRVKFYYLGLRLLLALLQRVLYVLTAGQLPPFASVAVVVRDGGRILMIARRDGNGYGLPGGHLKLHETAEEAAHREVEEETGLQLESARVIGTLSGRRPGTWVRTVDVVYEGRVASGTLRSSREGRCEWVEFERVRDHLAFDYRKILEP